MTDEQLDPATEQQVRRLLAAARHTGPMPAEVVDRLDSVLVDLANERSADPGGAPAAEPGAPVVDLASRRRRRLGGWLLGAAAACAVVVGVGPMVLDRSGDDGPTSAEPTSESTALEQNSVLAEMAPPDASPKATDRQPRATDQQHAARADTEVPSFVVGLDESQARALRRAVHELRVTGELAGRLRPAYAACSLPAPDGTAVAGARIGRSTYVVAVSPALDGFRTVALHPCTAADAEAGTASGEPAHLVRVESR